MENRSSGHSHPAVSWGYRLDEIPIDLVELTRERLEGRLGEEEYLIKEFELLEEFEDLIARVEQPSSKEDSELQTSPPVVLGGSRR